MMAAQDDVEWRDLEISDIPDLATFAPEDWYMALDQVLLQLHGHDYFHGWVAIDRTGLAAVGQGIATGRTGWVGNIIVRPDVRNRGLGTRMTREVMAWLRKRGCSSMLLVATPPGEPVYRKLGFKRAAEYVFLEVPRLAPGATDAIRRLMPGDLNDLLRIDGVATGEERTELLAPHLALGWGCPGAAGGLAGFFLPSLGAGLVVAETRTAGLSLLRFKHVFYPGAAVVPAGNSAALEFLLSLGAREKARAPRMVLGEEAGWRPERIFARAAGYCG